MSSPGTTEDFDAIVVGGGNKGLIVAIYLAKFGGMRVGVFETRHEAGGGWSTEESPAPGFLADLHCTAVTAAHLSMVEQDFPEWSELAGRTVPAGNHAYGAIFVDDGSPLVLYRPSREDGFELSRRSIARFSKRDADTLLRIWDRAQKTGPLLGSYLRQWAYSPAVPPGSPDALDRMFADPRLELDARLRKQTPLEVFRHHLESPELISLMLRRLQLGWGVVPESKDLGWLAYQVLLSAPSPGMRVSGGTHSWAHAAVKILIAHGGTVLTGARVERILVEGGRATGVELADGEVYGARELLVTTVDPYSLCFSLVGPQYFAPQTVRTIERLERRQAVVAWTTWALHQRPRYLAAAICPGVEELNYLFLLSRDPTSISRGWQQRKRGAVPSEPNLAVYNYAVDDPSRAPAGKATVLTEQYVPAADLWSERRWLRFKKECAAETLSRWQRLAPNMGWDNVVGYAVGTPADLCRSPNMAPTGNWAVIDVTREQFGRLRPVPELAAHQTPVAALYATGSAWHPTPGGREDQAYTCYKVIAERHQLRKPWEEAGRRI